MSAESYIWGLQGICQLHRIPFAPNLVLQQFPPPYNLSSLQQAANALGLNSGVREARATELPQLPTPFVAVLAPASSSPNAASSGAQQSPDEDPVPHRLAIVVKCDSDKISYFESSDKTPITATLAAFGEIGRASCRERV